MLPILAAAKAARGFAGQQVYEAGRAILPELYQEWERRASEVHSQDRDARQEELLREFRSHLEPTAGKFSGGLFQFYNQNAKALNSLLSDGDRTRLLDLVIGTVFKWDPVSFEVTVTAERDGVATGYTVSSAAAMFGAALMTAKLLGVDIAPFRQVIINYIPFADSEELRVLFELVGTITATELDPVVAVYREKKADVWRHQTTSFIDLVEKYHIERATPVLKSFVTDTACTPYARQRALIVLESLAPDPPFLLELFDRYKDSTVVTELELAYSANALLITQHGDANAVQWRLDQVLARVAPFNRPTGVHSVSALEDEVTHGMSFARPLIELRHAGYEQQYLALLDQAMYTWARGRDFHAYAEYLWNIVYGYFEGLKGKGSYEPLRRLEDKIASLKNLEGANWLANRMVPLRRSYLQYLGKPRGISDAIRRYNTARSHATARIATSADLHHELHNVLETDLRRWIEGEGAFRVILGGRVFKTKKQEYEKLIQKTLKAQIENILLRRGFQVEVIREPQLLDEKRTDFLIRYGFAGPVVVEVKLTSSKDVQRTDIAASRSYESMERYMEGYGASHGLFIAIANRDAKRLPKIQEAFEAIRNVAVIMFDLTKDRPKSVHRRKRATARRRRRGATSRASKSRNS